MKGAHMSFYRSGLAAFSLLVLTEQPSGPWLFLKKSHTSPRFPVQSRSENAPGARGLAPDAPFPTSRFPKQFRGAGKSKNLIIFVKQRTYQHLHFRRSKGGP